jgi:hypothetical protein
MATKMARVDEELIKAIHFQKKLLEETFGRDIPFSKASKHCAKVLINISTVIYTPSIKRKNGKVDVFPIIRG